MSTKSQEVGKAVLHGIDTLEATTHDSVHSGANVARHATRIGSRWAANQETAAMRKTRLLKRDLKKQSVQLRRNVNDTVDMAGDHARRVVASGSAYLQRKPWTAIAIASGAAILVGALLSRRRS